MSKTTYELNFFKSKFDNEVKNIEQFTWEEMCSLFSEHRVTETKNDLGFICAEFKKTDYEPALRGIYETINGEKIEVAKEVKFDANGKTIIGRYAQNIVSYNCLVFDYDGNGVNLDAKQKEFEDFQHLGYSSHNHIISGMHKFRMIFPFSDPCPIDEWAARQDSFRIFGGVDDKSTTAMARIFFAPTCPEEGRQFATTWNSQGVLLDWRVFAAKKQPISMPHVYTAPVSANGTGKVRFETFNMVQFFKDRGMYQGGNSIGKHDVTCFRQHEHNSNSAGGTVVWAKTGEWPSFYCGHSHNLTNKDFWSHYKDTEGIESIAKYCLREEVEETQLMKNLRLKIKKLKELI